MIERHWKGICRSEHAGKYEAHLITDTFKKLALLDGFINARILKRPVNEGVEFLIVTVWKSLESIHAFAGDNTETAVVPALVQRMMIRFDARAAHYVVAFM